MGARGRDPRKDKSLGAATAARWGYYARQCGKSRAGGARLDGGRGGRRCPSAEGGMFLRRPGPLLGPGHRLYVLYPYDCCMVMVPCMRGHRRAPSPAAEPAAHGLSCSGRTAGVRGPLAAAVCGMRSCGAERHSGSTVLDYIDSSTSYRAVLQTLTV